MQIGINRQIRIKSPPLKILAIDHVRPSKKITEKPRQSKTRA